MRAGFSSLLFLFPTLFHYTPTPRSFSPCPSTPCSVSQHFFHLKLLNNMHIIVVFMSALWRVWRIIYACFEHKSSLQLVFTVICYSEGTTASLYVVFNVFFFIRKVSMCVIPFLHSNRIQLRAFIRSFSEQCNLIPPLCFLLWLPLWT